MATPHDKISYFNRRNDPPERVFGVDVVDRFARLGRHWGWYCAVGISLVILGLLALGYPVSSTVGLTFALGLLFAVGGLVETVHAIRLRKEMGSGWNVVGAVAALATGVLLLKFPVSGMVGIAIAMTFYFFVSAATKTVIAFGLRPHSGSAWAFLSAVASFFLGVYMIVQFPFSALWVPGLLLGIEFIIHGSSLVGFSMNLRRIHKQVQARAEEPSETRRAA
jgi:uncharacterized membrane protein HdeD (DUF308 family)